MRAGSISSKIVMLSPQAVQARPGNPRKYSKRHKGALTKSISRYRFTVPILIDAKNMIVAGSARFKEVARFVCTGSRSG